MGMAIIPTTLPERMTDEQEAHLADVDSFLCYCIDIKYRKGQAEHGGNLRDMDLKTALINDFLEKIDGCVYGYQALAEAGITREEIRDAILFDDKKHPGG